MKKFKDNKGREWAIEITVATLKRIRNHLGVDLMKVIEGGELLKRLYADPEFLVDLLFVVCMPQAKEAGITDEAFGEGMAGDCIEAAQAALMEEIIGFCPSPKDRENLRAVWTAAVKGMDKARDVVTSRIQGGALDQIVARAVEIATSSSTPAPESSGSTPDPTPSES